MPVHGQISHLAVSKQQGIQISISLIRPRKRVFMLPINTTAHVLTLHVVLYFMFLSSQADFFQN